MNDHMVDSKSNPRFLISGVDYCQYDPMTI